MMLIAESEVSSLKSLLCVLACSKFIFQNSMKKFQECQQNQIKLSSSFEIKCKSISISIIIQSLLSILQNQMSCLFFCLTFKVQLHESFNSDALKCQSHSSCSL